MNKKHGMYGTPIYVKWRNIKNRCLTKTDAEYFRYGGRGITVCKEWADSFQVFYDYMTAHLGDAPSPKHSIDRIDNDKGYEPGNLRWASPREQTLNRRLLQANNTSGYRGVTWCKSDKRWHAQIHIDGKQKVIKVSKDKVECARAYNEAAQLHLGSLAPLNVIKKGE